MPDHVLPFPDPDWASPVPHDSSTLTPEQTDAVAALRALAGAIPLWVTTAILTGTAAKDWLAMADRLNQAARQCKEAAGTPEQPVIDTTRPDGR